MSLVFSFLRMAEDWQMNVSILSAIGKIGANIGIYTSTSVDFAKLAIPIFADCRVYVESIIDFVDYLLWLSIFSTALTSVDVAKFVMKISTDGVLPQNIPKLYGSWDKKYRYDLVIC
ncbi:hypothetical protein EEL40_13845 [Muribaculaceae bacterium Isolate-083 (Janvier)]|nr:hypothetical protein [Muribaculaceae bacterium S4]ROS93925.1 hypothetical protein EEL37_12725 [Muribaculaceae bacterium Isolate-077 (Janvier)]ROS94316.1 hypothetical protein EEL40_13845 [Muribaculaceae bacterium Isolate-083 (Janvier)]ROS97401.1 hypothetical protein EEL41_12495 [Muribaculaceae bacterium Isolate-084 (Janvier)]